MFVCPRSNQLVRKDIILERGLKLNLSVSVNCFNLHVRKDVILERGLKLTLTDSSLLWNTLFVRKDVILERGLRHIDSLADLVARF